MIHPTQRHTQTPALLILLLASLFLLGMSIEALAVDVQVSRLEESSGYEQGVRGGEIRYTVEVENSAADTAQDVTLQIPIPASTEFVSITGDRSELCAHDSGTPGNLMCDFGSLLGSFAAPPGPVLNLELGIRTTETTGAVVDITATAGTSSVDSNNANNQRTQNTPIVEGADLAVTSDPLPTPDPAVSGGSVTYSVRVRNQGPNTAVDPQVVVNLADALTYGSLTTANGWSCVHSSGTLTCDHDDLANAADSTFAFTSQITGADTGSMQNTNTCSSSTADPNPDNNLDQVNVTVNQGTDVSITVDSVGETVVVGENMNFTLRARNLGPHPAADVNFIQTLPPGFTWNSFTDPSGNWLCGTLGGSPEQVQCEFTGSPNFPVGDDDTITFSTTAPMDILASPENRNTSATIYTSTEEAADRLANNSDTDSLTLAPEGVDLRLNSKTKTPQPVAQGSAVSSVIRVRNDGPRAATAGEVVVADTLDLYEGYVGFSGSNWSCVDTADAPDVIECTYLAGLSIGAQTSALTITSTALEGFGEGASEALMNTACTEYTDLDPHDPVWQDFNSANNCLSATVTSTDDTADLQVAKTADAGGDTTLDDDETTIRYSVELFNAGPAGLGNITLTDTLAGFYNNAGMAGTTGVAYSYGPANEGTYNCSRSGSTVTCAQTAGTLTTGGTDTIFIDVSRPLNNGTQVNTASAYDGSVGDNNRSNNTDTASVTVEPVADLRVAKSVDPASVRAGVPASFRVEVTNRGPSAAQNVAVADTFSFPTDVGGADTGFTFLDATASGSDGSCSGLTAGQSYRAIDAPTLNCSWTDLAAHETQYIDIDIRPNWMASPPSPRTLTNNAEVSTSTMESSTGNNGPVSASLSVQPALANAFIDNTDNPDPAGYDPSPADPAENDVIYHVAMGNTGPSLATGAYFTYTMTPKSGKTLQFMCDEANAADACGTSANICAITGGANPVTGPASLTLTCTPADGKLPAQAGYGGHRYLHFRIQSPPDTGGDTNLTNAVVTVNEDETTTLDNQENEDTTVRQKCDLVLAKAPSSDPVDVGQPFAWTITVSNDGPGDSENTDVEDLLPAGMEFFGAAPNWLNNGTGANGSCTTGDPDGRYLSCSLGVLRAGESATITVPVRVITESGGSLQNCANATTSEVDPVSGNNFFICDTVSINPAASLAGCVWEDNDDDGVMDASENGIDSGAVEIMRLFGSDIWGNSLDRTETANVGGAPGCGAFMFDDLPPSGSAGYSLEESQPRADTPTDRTAPGPAAERRPASSTPTASQISMSPLARTTRATISANCPPREHPSSPHRA